MATFRAFKYLILKMEQQWPCEQKVNRLNKILIFRLPFSKKKEGILIAQKRLI